jgi:extracellular elastinolytic metalloproteinase
VHTSLRRSRSGSGLRRAVHRAVAVGAVSAVVAAGSAVAAGTSGAATLAAAHQIKAGRSDAVAVHAGRGDRDFRSGSHAPTARQRAFARSVRAREKVTFNQFGTPLRVAATPGRVLASGLSADPETAARGYLRAHSADFGLTADAVSSLQTVSVNPIGAGAAVLLQQHFGDLPAGNDGLVALGVVGGKVVSMTSSLARDVSVPAAATLSEQDAVRAALRDAGFPAGDLTAAAASGGWSRYDAAGVVGQQAVKAVAVPLPEGGVRAAYEVSLTSDAPDRLQSYTTYVDGRTGAVLVREDNVTDENDDPVWKAFPDNPPADYSSTDTRQTWCWTPLVGCDRAVANPSSPLMWDVDPATGASTHTSEGNNELGAEAWLSRGNSFTDADTATASPTRDYTYPWTNQWFTSSCAPTTFDSAQRNDIDAAITNLHAMHNRMHDFSYKLGFTESAWNLQLDNFGKGGLGNDPELGNAQSGARVPGALIRDNANQGTGPDGTFPLTNMFLWQPIAGSFYSPCVDGDYDMSVIGHEYTHAISNRMAAGPDRGLSGFQAGAMGESWSDLNGTEYLVENGFVPAGQDPYVTGQYVTGNPDVGIRDFAISRNPLNFSDVGFDLTGPEVHADGEIWNAVNFAVRQAFVAKYGEGSAAVKAACAEGTVPLAQCPGGRRWLQLMYDAWLLMANGNVSMVDARDAMVAADQLRFAGADVDLLADAFASRGLGQFAASNTNADTDPTPSFTSATGNNGTVRFRVTGQGQDSTQVKFFVGDFQARAVPVADSDPASPLPNTISMVPGRYTFVAQAPGFGLTRFAATIRRDRGNGNPQVVRVALDENLASSASGATAAGDGVNQASLIDDDEATNWAVLGAAATPVQGTGVTVNLAGGKQNVRRVQVSALLRPQNTTDPGGDTGAQNRFTALRQFRVLACVAKGSVDCTDARDFRVAFTSPANAFPAQRPRPVAPQLTLRSFRIPQTAATHLRFEVVSSQCTGNPAFAGQQSNDPAVPTDCTTGSTISGQVRAAEFQAFDR